MPTKKMTAKELAENLIATANKIPQQIFDSIKNNNPKIQRFFEIPEFKDFIPQEIFSNTQHCQIKGTINISSDSKTLLQL